MSTFFAVVAVIGADESVLYNLLLKSAFRLVEQSVSTQGDTRTTQTISFLCPLTISDAFGISNIINALGGYGKIISDGLISEAELIEAAGGYSALIGFFDTNDIINTVGMSKILEYVDINDVADSVGGFPALMAMYDPAELVEIARSVGLGKIRDFVFENNLQSLIDFKQLALDIIELLKGRIPETKEFIKTVGKTALSFLVNEVDGIYINGARVYEYGSFDLQKIIVKLLQAVPDIDDLISAAPGIPFASLYISADISGKTYSLGVEFSFSKDATQLQNKLVQIRDYYKLDVSDDLEIDFTAVIPSAVSSVYVTLLESERIPDTLKGKLIDLPALSFNDAREILAGLSDEELQKITDTVRENIDKIKDRALDAAGRGEGIGERVDQILDRFLTIEKVKGLRDKALASG